MVVGDNQDEVEDEVLLQFLRPWSLCDGFKLTEWSMRPDGCLMGGYLLWEEAETLT